jgi:hypothetical protein
MRLSARVRAQQLVIDTRTAESAWVGRSSFALLAVFTSHTEKYVYSRGAYVNLHPGRAAEERRSTVCTSVKFSKFVLMYMASAEADGH